MDIAEKRWPIAEIPPSVPLYVPVAEAAEIAGVSYERMRSWVLDAADPIPHLDAGRAKKLVRSAAIPAYAASRESA